MIEYKAANAASHKIAVTATATSLFSLMDTAGSVTTNAALLGDCDSFILAVEGTSIRILMDGNTPTASNGFLLSTGTYKFIGKDLAQALLIRVGGSNIACSVTTGTSTMGEEESYDGAGSAAGAVEGTAVLSTGEVGANKYLREDGDGTSSWQTVAGGGDVSKVGTPVNNQVGVWTGDGTLEGEADLTYDGTNLNLVTAKNFQIAGATVLADAAGTTTLSNIDAIDATTETTLEAAIDSLTNLVATGALDAGSISSNFGNIDNGASTLDSGASTLASLTVTAETSFGGAAGFPAQSSTGDGTTTIDWGLGNKYNFTFGAQNDTFTFTAPTSPGNFILKMVQDGTGSRTATWPATVKWPAGTAPTLTTAGGGIDIISFYYDGTNYYGNSSLAFA
uniref:Tail fiber protein n=1 Tax=uncultured marine virus TaxID=186617 RepID=A0A0F7L5U5_9VIRU|nr:hypothetical protein [uncultured marine virus]